MRQVSLSLARDSLSLRDATYPPQTGEVDLHFHFVHDFLLDVKEGEHHPHRINNVAPITYGTIVAAPFSLLPMIFSSACILIGW